MTKYQADKLYETIKYNDSFFGIAEVVAGRDLQQSSTKAMTICSHHFSAFLREWADAIDAREVAP